jgi:D-alanyl-D-alanine carboxypeptidase
MSIEQALYALSLDSVNTIGYALAEHISGSLDGFSKLMNEKAQAVGTVNTHFNNPHGLNDQTHLTTAHDMAKILWAAAENDIYRKIAGTEKYSFTDSFGKTINCSHGYKVFSRDSQYYDPRCVCGKTGYTSEAMFTRAVYATDGKLDLIAVTMHSDTTALAYQDIKTLADFVLIQVGWMRSGLRYATSRRLCAERSHLAFRRDFLHQLTDDPAVDELCDLAKVSFFA